MKFYMLPSGDPSGEQPAINVECIESITMCSGAFKAVQIITKSGDSFKITNKTVGDILLELQSPNFVKEIDV